MKAINFIVYQSGYAIFGVGKTRDEAIADAVQWIEDERGKTGGLNEDQIEELIRVRPNNGEFAIMDSNNVEFDDYMDNQGGFKKIDGKWYNED